MTNLLIVFLSLIYGVKNDDSAHGVQNFSYKLSAGKHVPDISLPNVLIINESGLDGDKDMPNMTPMFWPVKSNILKTLIHEAKALHENFVISTVKKSVCKGLVKMLSLQSYEIYYCITSFLYQVGTYASLECEVYYLFQFVKHVVSHTIQTPISVSSLIYGILSAQKKDISICVCKLGSAPSVLSLSYKLIIGKYVADIVIHIIVVDENDLVFDELFLYGPMRSHILKGFDLGEV